MADEVSAAAPVTASPVPEAAPVVTVTPEAAPQVAEAAVVTPPAESAASVTPAEPQKPLLGPEAAEAAPVETAIEPQKADAEPAPLPVYEFKLPEGAQADNAIFKSFNAKLGEFQNLSKADQANVQKFGQEMIDMHQDALKEFAETQNKSSWDWFNNRNKEWLESSKKDTQIGGERFNETVSAASQAISLYGGTKAQQLETAKLFQETGVENHPALLRFLANITKTAAKEGSPVSSQNVSVQKPGIAEAMYGKTSKGAA